MTVAHELAERGLDVTMLERRGRSPEHLGGKAHSFKDADGAAGEHGFRFFPGFYRVVIDQMGRTPDGSGGKVSDHLVTVPSSTFFADQTARSLGSGPEWARRADGRLRNHTWMLHWGIGAIVLAFSWWLTTLEALVLLMLLEFLVGVGRLTVSTIAGGGDLSLTIDLTHTDATIDSRLVSGARTEAGGFGSGGLDPGATGGSGEGPGGAGVGQPASERLTGIAAVIARRSPLVGALGFVPLASVALVAFTASDPPLLWWIAAAVAGAAWSVRRALGGIAWMWAHLRGAIPAEVRPGVAESVWAVVCMAQVVTACEGRRFGHLEGKSWWDLIAAERNSRPFQLALATGLTRAFVATRAEEMSGRTGGTILAQLLYDVNPWFEQPRPADRVLNGPTSQEWIGPWYRHLLKLGVRINEITDRSGRLLCSAAQVEVQHLYLDGTDGVIAGLVAQASDTGTALPGEAVRGRHGEEVQWRIEGEFDEYVLALSGVSARQVLANSTELTRWESNRPKGLADARSTHPMALKGSPPRLSGLFGLDYGWMNGVVFHFDRPLSGVLPEGHLLCLDSEWALTGIDQSRCWTPDNLCVDDGVGVLSINISDWETSSKEGIPARLCTPEQVASGVWRQLCDHMPDLEGLAGHRTSVVLDRAIFDPDELEIDLADGRDAIDNKPIENAEELLVNTTGSWANRCAPVTGIDNLFLAGDHVRTYVDFASMEGACESGRWVAMAIVERARAHHPGLASVEAPEPLTEPRCLRPGVALVRSIDRVADAAGFPHPVMIFTPVQWLSRFERTVREGLGRLLGPSDTPRRQGH